MAQIFPIERVASSVGDVIFVHGLGGHPLKTWGFEHDNSWHTWIKANRPDLNIWSIQYKVEPSEWRGGAMPLSDRALNILALLDNRGIGSKPIVFVTHSMGGLLVKEMLRHSLTVTTRFKSIAESTKAIVFFATPHTGAALADIANYFNFLLRSSVAISELASQQPRLRDLNLWYRNNYGQLGLKSCIFFETQETAGVRVVNETSADPGIPHVSPIPIDADHTSITKPDSYDSIVVGQTLKSIDDAIPGTGFRYDPDKQFQSVSGGRIAEASQQIIRPTTLYWRSLRDRLPIKPLLAVAGVLGLAGLAVAGWQMFFAPRPLTLKIDREMYIGHYVGLPQVTLKVAADNPSSSPAQLIVNSARLVSPDKAKQIQLYVEAIVNCNGSVPTTIFVSVDPGKSGVCVYSLLAQPNFGQLASKLDVVASQKGAPLSGPQQNLIEGPLLKEVLDLAEKNFPWEAGAWEIRLDYSLANAHRVEKATFNVSATDVTQLKSQFSHYGQGMGVYAFWRYTTPDGTQPMRQVAANQLSEESESGRK